MDFDQDALEYWESSADILGCLNKEDFDSFNHDMLSIIWEYDDRKSTSGFAGRYGDTLLRPIK